LAVSERAFQEYRGMSFAVLIGMDVGGTNTDVAMVDGDVHSVKVPNRLGIDAALDIVRGVGRLAVSSSQPLNRVLTGTPARVATLLIPGPGLAWPCPLQGAVNHRGDVVEQLDPVQARDLLARERGDVVAVAGKFSVRNPVLEEQAREIARELYPDARIAVSWHLGVLDYPARVTTTRLNARMKETVHRLAGTIGGRFDDFLFFKGDGGLASPSVVLENPSLLYHSSTAAVALGAYYLAREKDCLVIDIGGTTTELVPIRDGRPGREILQVGREKTLVESVGAVSIPYGGDSTIREGLVPGREGNALAFGGPEPTLTDALNCTGWEIGDAGRSAALGRERAGEALEAYYRAVVPFVQGAGEQIVVGTGYLAPFLVPEIARRAGTRPVIPAHADCANAVGVAVSRVSIALHARFDSGRRRAVFNGEARRMDHFGNDQELIELCRDEARARALAAGADPRDVDEVELRSCEGFDMVRGGARAGRIVDIMVQIAPGITVEAL
jgi:N-methylhydantoinase A/oxoprolinase/acetone carboxylase beta subunit